MPLLSVLSLNHRLGFTWLRSNGQDKTKQQTFQVTVMEALMTQKPKTKLLRPFKKSKIGYINKIKSFWELSSTKIKAKMKK